MVFFLCGWGVGLILLMNIIIYKFLFTVLSGQQIYIRVVMLFLLINTGYLSSHTHTHTPTHPHPHTHTHQHTLTLQINYCIDWRGGGATFSCGQFWLCDWQKFNSHVHCTTSQTWHIHRTSIKAGELVPKNIYILTEQQAPPLYGWNIDFRCE